MTEVKTPPLPTETYLPLSFWSDILMNFDKRVEIISENEGFGDISVKIKIRDGQLFEVELSDNINLQRVRKLVGNKAWDRAEVEKKKALVRQQEKDRLTTEENIVHNKAEE